MAADEVLMVRARTPVPVSNNEVEWLILRDAAKRPPFPGMTRRAKHQPQKENKQ
jgi:hypothetical protein